MGTEFLIAVGVFPVELLVYQVLMICAANFVPKNHRETSASMNHLTNKETSTVLRSVVEHTGSGRA